MAKKKSKDNSKKQLKGMLIAIWIIFILALGLFGFYIYQKRDTVADDLGFTTKFSYQTNANQDINALMITFLNALASSDQDILKQCVTDPSQYDDMTAVQSQSKIITSYTNINCYTVEGVDDNATVTYAVANITIAGVEVSPLDMLGPFYVVKEGNHYLIDNKTYSDDVNKHIEKVNKTSDIQDLYKMVKDDEDTKSAQDPAFKEFLERLNN